MGSETTKRKAGTHTLRTGSKLWPGDPGTKKLVIAYGERLVCVRYLYDPERGKRFTTVELIVDEGPWKPRSRPTPRADTVVSLRITPGDSEAEAEIQAAGGTWSPGKRVWRLWYDRVVELGLKSRIVRS